MSFGRFLSAFLLLLVVASIPLFATGLVLPLVDYPNHLARMYLLVHAQDPVLQQFYRVVWSPLPNLAMDGIVPPLERIMPLEWAGKVFVFLTFILLAGGTAALHRVLFRRWSLWPCLAFLLLYSRLLLWGFVGYLFGAGLALCAFAAWVALKDAHWAVRLALGFLFALAIYLSHLLAFGLYAVLIAGFEWGEIFRFCPRFRSALGRLLVGGLPFVPMLVAMVLTAEPGAIVFSHYYRKLDILFTVFDDYNRAFDVACFAIAVFGLIVAFARGWVRLAPELGLPLIFLVVAYLLLPPQLLTAAAADRRVPLMIFLALLGGSRWAARAPIERRFLGIAFLMFVARMAVVTVVWHQASLLYRGLLPAFDALARGSRIAVAEGGESVAVVAAPLVHFPVIALARRGAFVSTIFAFPTQQPIALQPPYDTVATNLDPSRLFDAYADPGGTLDAAQQAALGDIDAIAFTAPRPFTLRNTTGLVPVFVSPRFQLYRVAR